MASFVPFLVYFILSWRDHLRGRLLAMLEGDTRYTVSKALDGVAEMVRAYVIGNFLLGLLLSMASGLLFAVGEAAVLDRGRADERIPEPGSVHRNAAGADSAAGGRAARRDPSRPLYLFLTAAWRCCICWR